jgi:hypothetical protein
MALINEVLIEIHNICVSVFGYNYYGYKTDIIDKVMIGL